MHVTYCFLWENRSYHKFSIMHITLFCLFISHTIILLCTFLILSDLYTRYWQKWILITIYRSESFPLRVTGWPVELMAYAFLVVSPPDMSQRFEEMAVAASNKNSTKPGFNYPELEEWALQFILDCCESNISKYSKYLEGGNGSPQGSINANQANRTLLLKQLAKDLCISERRILYRTQYVSQKSLCCCCLCMCTMFQLLRFTCPPTDLRRYCVEDWGTWEVVNLELCHCSMGSESSSNKCIGYISRWIGSYWIVLVSLIQVHWPCSWSLRCFITRSDCSLSHKFLIWRSIKMLERSYGSTKDSCEL